MAEKKWKLYFGPRFYHDKTADVHEKTTKSQLGKFFTAKLAENRIHFGDPVKKFLKDSEFSLVHLTCFL